MEAVTSHRTPLASCEARARLALERGHISREVYQSLMGITAEALLTRESEEKNAPSTSSGDSTPQKHVTPCDTPPLSQQGSTPESLSPSSSLLQLPACPDVDLQQCHYKNPSPCKANGLKPRPRQEHNERIHESRPPSSGEAASPDDDRTILKLKELESQGFSLSQRARRFWAEEKSKGDTEQSDDDRILQFADACLKAYDPSQYSTHDFTTPSVTVSYTTEWPKQVGLVPESTAAPTVAPASPIKDSTVPPAVQAPSLSPMRDLFSLAAVASDAREAANKPARRLPKVDDANIRNYQDLWNARYRALAAYKRKHGSCNVPYRWAEDPKLGRWVQNQREFYKRGNLSLARQERLEALGFCWSVRRGMAYLRWGDKLKRDPSQINREVRA